jgi:hypothetical protein
MLMLMFRPVRSESTIMVRGAYFRICSDRTLRGPDNAVTANYVNGLWQLAQKPYRSFECEGEVYLRVTDADGRHTQMGPYPSVRVTRGAVFAGETWLGDHAGFGESDIPPGLWNRVTLLDATFSRAA